MMIIVTGGAGFIGSNIIRGLNRNGVSDILVVDNLKKGSKHLNLNSLDFYDYIDRHDLFNFLSKSGKVDAIFHQGACSDTTEADGIFMMKNNYEYSKKIFHYCQEKCIPFFHASSASVYGNGDSGFQEDPRCEYPLNTYAFSKFLFDNYLRKQMPQCKSQVVSLRYFNVYGPQEVHKGRMASVAFHLFHQLKETGEMKLFEGSRDFKRDFIYIDDVVDVNLHFYESGKSGIFNCGTGKAESFYQIAENLRKKSGGIGEISHIPFPDDLKGKYQRFTEADLTGLREAGYAKDFYNLEQGVGKYYELLEKTGGYYR